MASPGRADPVVVANPLVLRDEGGTQRPRRGDDDPVRRIAAESAGQPAALDKDGAQRLGDVQPRASGGLVKPVVQRTVQHELAFLHLLRHFLTRGDRERATSSSSEFQRLDEDGFSRESSIE